MFQYIIILIYLLNLTYCSAILISEENINNESNLGKLGANILVQHCKFKCETALILHSEDELADEFFKELSKNHLGKGVFTVNYNNFTANNTAEWKSSYKIDVTVLLLENFATIEEVIFNIEILAFWNLRGRFLVVAPGVDPDDDDEEWIQESFKSFWERQVLRVVICFWKNEPKIYSFNPFMEDFGTDVTNRPDLEQIFAHRIKDMNGHPIRLYQLDYVYKNSKVMKVVTENGKIEWLGMDGKFWGTTAYWLNATLDVHNLSEDFEESLVSKTEHDDVNFRDSVKVLADMYDFDIMCNAGRTYEDNDLDHVFLYDRNDMYLVLPRGKQIPRYLYIFLIIPLDVWGFTLISLVLISLLELFVQKWNSNSSDIILVFINNYRLLLNESVPSKVQHHQEKFLMIVWIMFCIVFCTLFQSVLMTTLVSPQYYPDIHTLQDLFKTDMMVYAPHWSLVHFVRSLQHDNIKILDHLKDIPKNVTIYGETIDWMDTYRFDYGIVISTEQVYYLKINNKNEKRPDFYVMSEILMPNAQAYNIRNERLFYEEVLEAMGRIQQAGLYEFWRKYNYGIDVKLLAGNTSIVVEEIQGNDDSLTIEHLEIAFMILFLGAAMGILSFSFEIIIHKCKT